MRLAWPVEPRDHRRLRRNDGRARRARRRTRSQRRTSSMSRSRMRPVAHSLASMTTRSSPRSFPAGISPDTPHISVITTVPPTDGSELSSTVPKSSTTPPLVVGVLDLDGPNLNAADYFDVTLGCATVRVTKLPATINCRRVQHGHRSEPRRARARLSRRHGGTAARWLRRRSSGDGRWRRNASRPIVADERAGRVAHVRRRAGIRKLDDARRYAAVRRRAGDHVVACVYRPDGRYDDGHGHGPRRQRCAHHDARRDGHSAARSHSRIPTFCLRWRRYRSSARPILAQRSRSMPQISARTR